MPDDADDLGPIADPGPQADDEPPEVFEGEIVEEPEALPIRGDGRHPGEQYPDDFKLRAQIYYAAGSFQNLRQIAEALGVPHSAVQIWKREKEPDGQDWEEVKKAFAEKQWSVIADVMHETAAQEAGRLVILGRMLRESVHAALATGDLFNEAGQQVEFLFTAEGKRVLVGGIRPKTMTEAAHAIRVIKLLTEMRDVETEMREREEQLFLGVGKVLHELLFASELSDAQWERYRMKLGQLKAEGRLPKALEGPGGKD